MVISDSPIPVVSTLTNAKDLVDGMRPKPLRIAYVASTGDLILAGRGRPPNARKLVHIFADLADALMRGKRVVI